MKPLARAVRAAWQVLVDPVGAQADQLARPQPAWLAAVLGGVIVLLGAATVPRQLAILAAALAPAGDALAEQQQLLLRAGVFRLMIADRLIPPPTPVLAALLLGLAAEPVLAQASDRRRAIWALVVLGLAPLVVGRLGELAITYLVPASSQLTPGDALTLPQRFASGPRLLWRGGDGSPAPQWVELLEPRVNLVLGWSLGLWTLALKRLDGGGLAPWHVLVPGGCLLLAGLLTWALGPLAVAFLLPHP